MAETELTKEIKRSLRYYAPIYEVIDKNGETLVVHGGAYDNEITITRVEKEILVQVARIYVDPNKKEYVWINDIYTLEKSKGYGSIAMDWFLKNLKNKGVSEVRGMLAKSDLEDPEHRKRLEGFYKKHGFEITIRQDNTGSIYRKL